MWRFNALMIPMRAIIVGPPDVAIKAPAGRPVIGAVGLGWYARRDAHTIDRAAVNQNHWCRSAPGSFICRSPSAQIIHGHVAHLSL